MDNQLKSISLPNLKEDASNMPNDSVPSSHAWSNEDMHKASDKGKIKCSGLTAIEVKKPALTESKPLLLSRVFSSRGNEPCSDVSSSESSGDAEQVLGTKRCHQVPTTVILPDACAVQYGFQNTLKLVDFQPISDSDLSDQEAGSSSIKPRPKSSACSKFKMPRRKTESSSGDQKLQALLINPESSTSKGNMTMGSIKSKIGKNCKEYLDEKDGAKNFAPNQMGKTGPPRRKKLEAGDECSSSPKGQSAKQKVQIGKESQEAKDTAKTAGRNSHTLTNKMVKGSNKIKSINLLTNSRNVGQGPHKKSEGNQPKMKNDFSKKSKKLNAIKATITKAEPDKDDVQSSRFSDIHPVRDERVSRQLKLEVQHALTLSVRRWAEYLGKDNLKQEELKNALQYRYNDIALEMICENDTTVWSLLQDIGQCGCLHC